ncbi:MAG: molecular chaperone TorD family protein [Anaerolineales bacterium]
MTSISALYAEIYYSLAELYSQFPDPAIPDWISLPGKDWPLLSTVLDLTEQQSTPKLEAAIEAINRVKEGSIQERQREYQALFIGKGNPLIWLYESYYVDGRVPGPITFTIKNLYSDTELEVAGAELPDHASVQLAFLAHLAEKETQNQEHAGVWRSARRLFLKNHFMRWFPEVIKGLTRSGYPSWVAIGYVSEAVLNLNQDIVIGPAHQRENPIITNVDKCTLCGFCVQECPTRALSIQEDNHSTSIWLSMGACTGCNKCALVCPESVLILSGKSIASEKIMLRKSPRSICPGCGMPTVSEAELAHVGARLGNPDWLVYCLNCRQDISHIP